LDEIIMVMVEIISVDEAIEKGVRQRERNGMGGAV
jgi:hypothetical protein